MRIDPWLLIAVLAFCGLLIALVLSSTGKSKKNVAVKRLQSLAPTKAAKDEYATEARPKEPLLALLPASLQQKMRGALTAAGGKLSFESLVAMAAITGAFVDILGVAIIGLSGIIATVAGVAAGLVLPWFVLRTLKTRHKAAFLRLFPDGIDLIVRAVRAGLPVSVALDAAGQETPDPVGVEFRTIIADIRIGIDLDEALARAGRRIRLVDFDFFVASLVLQRKSGGNLSETLAILSSVLRKREELRAKTKAMTSEARTSAIVLAALPFFTAGAILVVNPSYFGILFTDPHGSWVLGGTLLCLTLGMLSMRILIQKALV
jgi:Flp pilus assembly protein TadB